jgi:hypothetical protein
MDNGARSAALVMRYKQTNKQKLYVQEQSLFTVFKIINVPCSTVSQHIHKMGHEKVARVRSIA